MSVEPATAYTGKFRLRTIFLLVCLLVLLLPLGGLFFFRIYENELVRQTELELIAQASVLATGYERMLARSVPDENTYGLPLPADYQREVIDGYYTPVYPRIDLAKNPLLPKRPDPQDTALPADPYAAVAGMTITPLLRDVQRTMLSGLLVLDYQGIIVAGQAGVGESLAQTQEVQAALQGQYSSAIRERDTISEPPAIASLSRGTGIRVFAAYPVLHNNRVWGVVYLSRTPQNILKHLHAEKDKVLLAGITVLAITLFIVGFISTTVTRPIHRLIDKTRRVTEGDMNAMTPLRHPGTKEVEMLSQSFSRMASALHERTEYIREFATHVSHEFKTPITGIQGATELLVEHLDDMEPTRKRRFLNNIMQDTDRLKRLTTRLLELAQADNLTPSGETCYVMPVLMRLQDKYQAEKLTVTIEGEGHCDVLIPGDHFESIMANLLDNAHQHGAKNIRIDLELDEPQLTIRVADNGEGISEANREKVFQPFFTTRREQGGTGLGLGIVRSLVMAYGGTITAEPAEQGAVFVLTLPAAQ